MKINGSITLLVLQKNATPDLERIQESQTQFLTKSMNFLTGFLLLVSLKIKSSVFTEESDPL